LTAGESHGKGLTVILEGFPAHLSLSSADIDPELARRQGGYGRGGRMKIETDRIQILSGVRGGFTLGSPITLFLENKDFVNWQKVMASEPGPLAGTPLTRPRPGHADLSGGIKYAQHDLRNILERASARETAMRVVAGAVAKKLISQFGMTVQSHVVRIGMVASEVALTNMEKMNQWADVSPVRMLNPAAENKAMALIDRATRRGDTLGGVFEVVATGVPAGLGSHVQWDRKLDARLAQALMSLQSIKGVEIGCGFSNAARFGSQVHDAISYKRGRGFFRTTNRAGGIEGGMSNGEPLVVRAAQKPIATLRQSLSSVDVTTKKKSIAGYERSDVCAVPAGSVIGESLVAWVLADAFLEKVGGDHLKEIQERHRLMMKRIREY